MTGIPVIAARALDPGTRVALTLPAGLTLAAIIDAALPDLPPDARARARVSLAGPRGSAMILPEHWPHVRPKPGIRVLIRVIPTGDDGLRTILSIAVSVAAVALGQAWAASGSILGFTGQTAGAIVSLGVNLVGSLLVNALVPPPKEDKARPRYAITGWRNRLEPDAAVPVLMGALRFAPPFAAPPHTEIVGDWQHVRALFCLGEGRIEVSAIRIGETAIEEYDEVQTEIREGVAGDAPVSIYPRQVLEESVGVELTRPLPRDDLGEVIDGAPTEDAPVVRTTGADAAEVSVILAWPAGLIRVDGRGRKRDASVQIRIEQRLVTAEAWTLVETLTVKARRAEGMYRQHGWALPARGRWQVRLTMLTPETEDSQIQRRTTWVALQTIRPEYPIAWPRPLALLALRIKATHQINGSLDNINLIGKRICPDWDHAAGAWVTRATSNPAALFRHALQSPANPKAVADAGLDLALLQDWHDFCRIRSLTYDRLLDQAGGTLREVLTEIAAAGRATPRHDGARWGVVIDRPSDLIVDHVSPRNSWGFRATRSYAEQPHALVVSFTDAGNDFKPAQRVVPRPGYAGEITLTEAIDMPWVTDAAVAWREGLRRWHELLQRPDTYTVTQEGSVRVATRGDTLALSHDVLSRTHWAGRVREVSGPFVLLDEEVTMEEGETYGLRFRSGLAEGETVGESTVRTVVTEAGATRFLTVAGAGAMPAAGDLVLFGPLAAESFRVLVTRVETTADQCAIITAIPAADDPVTGIDALTDAAASPAWSSRVGAEVDPSLLAPAAPRFVSIRSGLSGAGAADTIAWLAEPGPGAIAVASYALDHRPGTSGAWTTVAVPAAGGGGTLTAHADGATVQLRLRAQSAAGIASADSAIVTLVVGAGDAPIPAALDEAAVTVTALLGGALIQFATGGDAATAAVQVYRSTSATLDRAADAAGDPHPVSPHQTWSVALGDTTRANLVTGGGFASAGDWTAGGTGWSVAGGVASHAAGAWGTLGETLAPVADKWYRIGFTVAGRSAGMVLARFTGGTTRQGPSVTANGPASARIQAAAGNTTFQFYGDAAFNGAVDDAVVYRETAACLAQGTHYLWLEPQNDEGAPGPLVGPLTITII